MELMQADPRRSRGYGLLGASLPWRENMREVKRGRIQDMLQKGKPLPEPPTPLEPAPEPVRPTANKYEFLGGATYVQTQCPPQLRVRDISDRLLATTRSPLMRGQYSKEPTPVFLKPSCDKYTPCRGCLQPGYTRDQVEYDSLLRTNDKPGKDGESKPEDAQERGEKRGATRIKANLFSVKSMPAPDLVCGYGGLSGTSAADNHDDASVMDLEATSTIRLADAVQPVLSAVGVHLARAGSRGHSAV